MKKSKNHETPIAKPKLRKGDLVQVIAGDHRGKQGRILQMVRDTNRAVVEGLNLVSRHTKPSAASPNGGIIKKEAPIHLSNLQLVVAGKPTRVGRKTNEAGDLVRFAKSNKEIIPS
jgi:large subunit ribosomal protein L24